MHLGRIGYWAAAILILVVAATTMAVAFYAIVIRPSGPVKPLPIMTEPLVGKEGGSSAEVTATAIPRCAVWNAKRGLGRRSPECSYCEDNGAMASALLNEFVKSPRVASAECATFKGPRTITVEGDWVEPNFRCAILDDIAIEVTGSIFAPDFRNARLAGTAIEAKLMLNPLFDCAVISGGSIEGVIDGLSFSGARLDNTDLSNAKIDRLFGAHSVLDPLKWPDVLKVPSSADLATVIPSEGTFAEDGHSATLELQLSKSALDRELLALAVLAKTAREKSALAFRQTAIRLTRLRDTSDIQYWPRRILAALNGNGTEKWRLLLLLGSLWGVGVFRFWRLLVLERDNPEDQRDIHILERKNSGGPSPIAPRTEGFPKDVFRAAAISARSFLHLLKMLKLDEIFGSFLPSLVAYCQRFQITGKPANAAVALQVGAIILGVVFFFF